MALATAVTIFVIASSYSQIVELFPSGGGGYLVASKLLSPTLGMISGSALLIDYVLTITLSVASGADAIFSFLPLSMQPLKIALAVAGVLVLTLLNLRGVKESVAPLVPIFLLFLLTHTFAIVYALVTHVPEIGQVARDTAVDVHAATAQLGTFGVIVLVLRAYSMGAGTYTGIEAVSNGLPILREPRCRRLSDDAVHGGVTGLHRGRADGRVPPVPCAPDTGTHAERGAHGKHRARVGKARLRVRPGHLISEAVLLFVAAQTGFQQDTSRSRSAATVPYRWKPVCAATKSSTASEMRVTRTNA